MIVHVAKLCKYSCFIYSQIFFEGLYLLGTQYVTHSLLPTKCLASLYQGNEAM